MYSAKFNWEVVSYNNTHFEESAWLEIPEVLSPMEIKAIKDSLQCYFNENSITVENVLIETPGNIRSIKIETANEFEGNENWLYFNNYTRWLHKQ